MLSNKLTQIFRTFSSKEFKKFIQFVESPYFNRNPRLITLAKLIQRAAPDFNSGKLEKEAVFAAMYGKEVPYNEQQVYDHVSFLMRLTEEFIAQQEYQEDTIAKKSYFLRSMTDKKLEDHFSRGFKKAQKEQERKEIEDHFYYLDNFLLSREAYRFYGKKHTRGLDDSLSWTVTNLDVFYLTAKLRYTCDMYNRANIVNVEYQPELMDEIGDYLQDPENAYFDIPAVSVYYTIYKMLTDSEDESHYHKLVELLTEHSGKFTSDEAHDLYGYAQNYCVGQANKGNTGYLGELFGLFKLMEEKEMLVLDGYIDHRIYKNIVTTGLNQKEFEWIRGFIETYKDLITPEFRETAYNYNLAYYHYQQKEYNKAMRLLQQAEVSDWSYYLNVKQMLLRIYYDLEEYDALESLISTYGVYLKRNKTISEVHRRANKNLLKFVKKAHKIRLQKGFVPQKVTEKQANELMEQIQASPRVSLSSWLRGRVGDLL